MEEIVQINFEDQSKYESNKGFIKDIIKRQHGLSNFDAVKQCWYSKLIQDVEVQRITDISGLKTIAIKVIGSKKLADSLVLFVKDIKGIEVNWLENYSILDPIDKEVMEIVKRERNKFSRWMDLRVKCNYISRDSADHLIEMWANAVRLYEYNKRGKEGV